MSPPTGQPRPRENMAEAARAASELLEVLWGRGQEAAPSGTVSPSQLRALLVLERYDGTNLRSLGRALGSRPPSVSRLCDRMEALGLVERRTSTTSRRELELRLSERGRKVLQEHRAIRAREVRAVLDGMDASAVAALATGLTAFHEAASARLDTAADAHPADDDRGSAADSA